VKLDDALQTIMHFFNDVIGAVIPGLVLATGILLIHRGMYTGAILTNYSSNGLLISMILVLSFATGHGLLAIYNEIFDPFLKLLKIIKGDKVTEKLETRRTYQLFKDMIEGKINKHPIFSTNNSSPSWCFHDLRSVALSVSKEGASLGRRFMFISLLCNGIGTALILLAIDYVICFIWLREVLESYPNVLHPAGQLLIMVLFGVFFIRRGDTFYKRAMLTPFSIAVTELLVTESQNEETT
jgi:hypothetical protein